MPLRYPPPAKLAPHGPARVVICPQCEAINIPAQWFGAGILRAFHCPACDETWARPYNHRRRPFRKLKAHDAQHRQHADIVEPGRDASPG